MAVLIRQLLMTPESVPGQATSGCMARIDAPPGTGRSTRRRTPLAGMLLGGVIVLAAMAPDSCPSASAGGKTQASSSVDLSSSPEQFHSPFCLALIEKTWITVLGSLETSETGSADLPGTTIEQLLATRLRDAAGHATNCADLELLGFSSAQVHLPGDGVVVRGSTAHNTRVPGSHHGDRTQGRITTTWVTAAALSVPGGHPSPEADRGTGTVDSVTGPAGHTREAAASSSSGSGDSKQGWPLPPTSLLIGLLGMALLFVVDRWRTVRRHRRQFRLAAAGRGLRAAGQFTADRSRGPSADSRAARFTGDAATAWPAGRRRPGRR